MPVSVHPQTHITTAEISTSNVQEAIRIVSACFSHEQCKDDISNVYHNYAHGIRRMESFGQDVSLLRYEALLRGSKLLGAGGIYRVNGDSPYVTWLGWLGVDPSVQGQGYGAILLRRIFMLGEQFNSRELRVYTPAHLTEYARCRAVYKHLGFLRQPEHDFKRVVEGDEVEEYLLVKPLPESTVSSLADVSFKNGSRDPSTSRSAD